MTERFDAVVVGSGFGGSVVAYRLAKAGKRVCLFERGKPYPPGSFSRTPLEMRNNFWDPSRSHYGLFNAWSFRDMAAIVSSGLGGGSLIYANVFIRKDDHWFSDPLLGPQGTWPISRAELDPHYDAVEAIVQPQSYPAEYQHNNKTTAMQQAADRLRFSQGPSSSARIPSWYLPSLAVTFTVPGDATPLPGRVFDDGDNYHRLPRETCRLCGECDVGCNYGSKNTLDYTYVTLGQRLGVDIRPLTEVKAFVPLKMGGYRVTVVKHEEGRATTPTPLPFAGDYDVWADTLVLSAGSLGTTYLLLKMQAAGAFPGISSALGSRFSGNGDLLMFVTRCKDLDGKPLRLNASRAPVITSTFRFPDGSDDGSASRGFYLQDAGYPLALDYVWELLELSLVPRIGRFLLSFFKSELGAELDRRLTDVLGQGVLSSTSMPLLGMGRDVPNGTMSTRPDPRTGVPRLQLHWDDRESRGYINEAITRAKQVAAAIGGRFTLNPITRWLNDLITVHPLGGCPMTNDSRTGVVDRCGQVFGYPGLYIADGSIMPGPVGANPSFTIAALGDHVADCILSR